MFFTPWWLLLLIPAAIILTRLDLRVYIDGDGITRVYPFGSFSAPRLVPDGRTKKLFERINIARTVLTLATYIAFDSALERIFKLQSSIKFLAIIVVYLLVSTIIFALARKLPAAGKSLSWSELQGRDVIAARVREARLVQSHPIAFVAIAAFGSLLLAAVGGLLLWTTTIPPLDPKFDGPWRVPLLRSLAALMLMFAIGAVVRAIYLFRARKQS